MVCEPTPQDFRYWERRKSFLARALRRAGKLALGFDLAPSDDVAKTFAAMRFDADPLAEAFVDEVYLGRSPEEGRALLDQALREGIDSIQDAPASLRALFADIENDPDWVDQELVTQGARVFRGWGTSVFRFGGAITLAAYKENSVAKPLVLTGVYTGSTTRHRFLETSAFWIAVSEPGGLAPGAPGRSSALRVRIMHVFVRRKLLSHPEWNTAEWGVPINQADALLTLMGGSAAPAFALRLLGFRPSRQEIAAVMHFWRYVGHLMGVRPRFYPKNLREALQLGYLASFCGSNAAGDDGRELCRAYFEAFEPSDEEKRQAPVSSRWQNGLHRGYTRLFVPPWLYRKLGLPPARMWGLAPLAGFPVIYSAETLRRHSRTVADLWDRAARAQRRRWFERHMGDRAAEYNPARTFTR